MFVVPPPLYRGEQGELVVVVPPLVVEGVAVASRWVRRCLRGLSRVRQRRNGGRWGRLRCQGDGLRFPFLGGKADVGQVR